MKKIIVAILAIFICTSSVLASEYTKFSRKFIKHFKDCDAYEETVTSEYEGQTFKTVRKIHGWKNGRCKYTEVISSKDGSYKLNCNIIDIQVDDLYEAMRNRSKKAEKYSLDLYYPVVNKKTGETEYKKNGSTIIKGNKAYIEWAKIQNNPYICAPERLDKPAK